jgi:hypothetical protein
MAGQSVGFVTREQSTAEIIEELVSQALAVLAARSEGVRQRQLVSHEILPGSQASPEAASAQHAASCADFAT